ncbi:MAG: glycosyltransferase family 39 protein [bacterium]
MGKGKRSRRSASPGSVAPRDVSTQVAPAVSQRVPWRHIVWVGLVALGFRVLFWTIYSRSPFFQQPVVDASFFDLWAQNLAAGHQPQTGVFFKPPLYAYLLMGMYNLWGRSLTAVYLFQTVLGAASCGLVLALGRQLFSPRIALTGALAVAVLPLLPFLELQLLAESVTTFLTLLALVLFLAGVQGQRGSPWTRLGLAGICLGIAALGRPNLLLVPLALAGWLLLGGRTQPAVMAGRSRSWAAGIMLLGTVLALSPVTIRNARVSGDLVPVCANLGVNLWAGSRPDADGISAIPVGVRWDDLQLECGQAAASGSVASSRYLMGKSLAQMKSDPGRALALLGKKLGALVTAHEIRNNIGPAFLAREQAVFLLHRWWPSFWLLGPLAFLGMITVRRLPAGGQVLWLYLAALALSVLPFFVNARFRAPMLPVLALFAAAAAFDLGRRFRQLRSGRRGPFLRSVLLLAGMLIVVNVDWFDFGNRSHDARDHGNLAMILAQGYGSVGPDPAAAAYHYEQAVALDPADPDLHERYGQFLTGRALPYSQLADEQFARHQWRTASSLVDSAARYLEPALGQHRQAAAIFPRSFRSHSNIGTCLLCLADGPRFRAEVALADGDSSTAKMEIGRALDGYHQAAAAYQEALRINPGFPEAASNIQLCLQRLLELPGLTLEVRQYQDRLRQQPGAATRR